MSELHQKQVEFAVDVAKLIQWVVTEAPLNYEVTLGDAYRTAAAAAINASQGIGVKNSLHGLRLAIDLNLFIDGVYQSNSAAYAPLGKFWKSLRPENAWGGDFTKPDGNHFSRSHEGVR